MPIYMDRHDVSDTVTAENVAQLHQEDLKIQHKFNCRGLTYWFDDRRKTAFCLIEAPNEQTIREMHNEAHGQVPHKIIEVEASIVESFLGRIEDPEKAQNSTLNIINDPAFRTIMLMELQQTTFKQNNDGQIEHSLNEFYKAVINLLKDFNGTIVKQTCYSFLVSFKSVTQAVHTAVEIQSVYKRYNDTLKNNYALPKIALSAGVPVTSKQLIFEDTIKLAERMCEIISGEIIISTEVKELFISENSNHFIPGENVIAVTQEEEKFLTLLMDYIDSTWTDSNLKVDDFSRPLGLSKSQLYRKMILLTGKSPNTFIKAYRLTRALKLLNKNSGNISEIAFETGFTSPSYFSKCFLKRYGHMPSAYLPAKIRLQIEKKPA